MEPANAIPAIDRLMAELNPQQCAAATHGQEPLLIVAGAGTGKTATLVHRVAWLIASGIEPQRILLLTFTRRSAEEMLRRVDSILRLLRNVQAKSGGPPVRAGRVWGGTFHAVATRLLRRYGKAVGLPTQFSVHDRTDSEDLLGVVRSELGLAKSDKRFPQKSTCLDIYSRCVNARQKLDEVLVSNFPWCKDWGPELGKLFDAYVDRKESAAVMDYDDLLLYWHALLSDAATSDAVRKLFDCVLVDEYQDTNLLQAEILYRLCPEGRSLTVVGDDAQSIYSFRAATVRNILDFPTHYPGTALVTLEQNYRSTMPILEATNRVIGLTTERFTKDLWSTRKDGQRPAFVLCKDETEQADSVIRHILDYRETGIPLRRQAVLFRASHHSMVLEAELARRGIPFHKYGGLKFVETGHVKDLMAFLRLAENPRDVGAGTRLLGLLPGIGPVKARQLVSLLEEGGGQFSAWQAWKPPAASATLWPQLLVLIESLSGKDQDLPGQVYRVRMFYTPLMRDRYDNAHFRERDLVQLEQIAARYRNRRRMLLEMALDPPSSTQELAGEPHLDDDYLVLSTIHSAKGLEWDAVHVIHAADGNIPSDMGTKTPESIEEERRLFYVALTRAKNLLYVYCPQRYYYYRPGAGDNYGYALRTRFLPEQVLAYFQQTTAGSESEDEPEGDSLQTDITSESIRRQAKRFWS